MGMSADPPEPFRMLGSGDYDFVEKYRHFDCYEDYHDCNSSIPGYR